MCTDFYQNTLDANIDNRIIASIIGMHLKKSVDKSLVETFIWYTKDLLFLSERFDNFNDDITSIRENNNEIIFSRS